MGATIKVKLNEAGRKAQILAGGSGEREQSIAVGRDDPAFAAVVQHGTVSGSDVILDQTYYGSPEWDHLPTAAEVVAEIDRRRTEADAEKARKTAEQRAEYADCIAERRTGLNHISVSANRDGLTGRAEWTKTYIAWPGSGTEDDVTDLVTTPEVATWRAEIEAGNEAAKAKGEQEAEADLAAKIAARDADRAAEKARRESLGLADGELDLAVEDGALSEVPANCWESHSRGKNWLAVIAVDPSAPGGLARTFQSKAKGSYYYLTSGLSVGDAIEFGADYYSGRGRKSPTRWYGFVTRITDSMVVVRQSNTGKAAVKDAAKWRAKNGPAPVANAVAAGIARINGEGRIV